MSGRLLTGETCVIIRVLKSGDVCVCVCVCACVCAGKEMLCIISYRSASSDTYRKPSTTMHHRVLREAISFQLLEISALLISRQTNIH